MSAYFKIIILEKKNFFIYLKLRKIAESHYLGGFIGDWIEIDERIILKTNES